jgi:peroxiredoxin (alkyl hydroperoxide reductase subunit C)
MRGLAVIAVAGVTLLAGCRAEDLEPGSADASLGERVALGPVDGQNLPGTALERVQVGQEAPDFTLASLAGPTVTLSQYRGAKNVVLVFYRGHW